MCLQQEIVLGIGGWRLLEMLGIDCPVCHLNEGHAAFAIFERVRQFMQRSGQPFQVALWTTRVGNLFTTHTPVSAGFDCFTAELFSLYFRELAVELEIEPDKLLALGRLHAEDSNEPFNISVSGSLTHESFMSSDVAVSMCPTGVSIFHIRFHG